MIMLNINELINKAINSNEPINCPKGIGCPFKKHACLMKHPGSLLYVWNKDCLNGKDCIGNGKICELKHPDSKDTFFVDKRKIPLTESRPFISLLPLPSYSPGVNDYEPPLHTRSTYISPRRDRSRSRERDYDRRNYDRRDYDRRDYDRRDYNKLDYDRRNYDKLDYDRRDYDRRDYNKLDYDRQDYDRRDYDKHDYDRREEVIIPYVNDKDSLCINGAYCKYHKDKICRFMHPDQIKECLQINRIRGVYAAMTRAKQYKNEAKNKHLAKKY